MKDAKVVSENEIKNIVRNIPNGKFFSMAYVKANGELRMATCQKGVHNPTNSAKPKGTGESAKEALEKKDAVIKYFDSTKENPDGTRGAYRSCRVDRLLRLTTDGMIYVVKH